MSVFSSIRHQKTGYYTIREIQMACVINREDACIKEAKFDLKEGRNTAKTANLKGLEVGRARW